MHGVFWDNGFMELGSSSVTKVLVVRKTRGNNLKNFCEFWLKMAVRVATVRGDNVKIRKKYIKSCLV